MLLFLLVLLQIKHWYIDFVNQTMEEVNHKGIYGNLVGIGHSIKHGLATALCVWIAVDDISFAILFGFLDFFIHYHIDFAKMYWGCRDVTQPAFWNQLGLDQMAHQLTYIGIIAALATLL